MRSRTLVAHPVGDPASVRRLLDALEPALDGDAPVLAPNAGRDRSLDELDDDPDDPVVVAVSTSGSAGRAQQVLLGRTALLASATAAHLRLGGPGRWLLALPAHHIAGVNVLVRSLVSGTAPVLLDLTDGFTPDGFATACRDLTGPDHLGRYTALVPTQLVRLLDAGGAALAELARLDAVLVGGAATSPSLAARAREAGVALVTSYGMSETCGGCVYDGIALDGVTVRFRPLDRDTDREAGCEAGREAGRIELAGPVLARGYLGESGRVESGNAATGSGFVVDGTGRRWFVTDDAGRWVRGKNGSDAMGSNSTGLHLQVDGRLDGAVTTGGLTVPARAVEELLAELPGVAEAVVVGLPDTEWGQRLVAAVVAPSGVAAPDLAEVRRYLTERLGAAAAPRELKVLHALPTRGPGKPDRAAVAELFE